MQVYSDDEGETFKIGGFNVVASESRASFYRSFPETYLNVAYADIENIQHVTELNWAALTKSLIFLNAFFLFFLNEQFLYAIIEFLNAVIPAIVDKMPVYFLSITLWFVLLIYGTINLGSFLMSLKGSFIITRSNNTKILIHTKLTPDVRRFITHIQAQKDTKRRPAPRVDVENVLYEDSGVVKSMKNYWGMILGIKKDEEHSKTKKQEDDYRPVLRQREVLGDLENIEKRKVILVSAKGEGHPNAVISVLKKLVNDEKMGGVYLSFTKPSDNIISNMQEQKIREEDVYFIDCVSIMAGKIITAKKDRVAYVENPSSLEDITLHIDNMLSKVTTDKKFLFLDSLSSLSIYNNDKSVKEFTHYLINKVRLHDLIGIILTVDKKETEELVRIITPMCDHQIKF